MIRRAASIAALTLAALAAPAAGAFERDRSPEGAPRALLRRPSPPRLVGEVPGVDRREVEQALERAARAWSSVQGSQLSLVDGQASGGPPITVEVVTRGWSRSAHFVAHTEIVDGRPAGAIAAAIVRLNAQHHAFCAGSCADGQVPIEPVLLHELGHAIGLEHCGVRGAVMFPGLGRSARAAPVALSSDDEEGVRSIYARPFVEVTGARVEPDQRGGHVASDPGAPSPASRRGTAVTVAVAVSCAIALAAIAGVVGTVSVRARASRRR